MGRDTAKARPQGFFRWSRNSGITTGRVVGVAASASLLLLAGCADLVDTDAARICRTILPAVSPDGARINVERQIEARREVGLDIGYMATLPDGETSRHQISCRFAGPLRVATPDNLDAVTIDGEPMGEARLFFLRRFWLETSDAATADPEPVLGAADVAQAPFFAAYSLQQAVNALPSSALYALVAAAYSLVYGLVGRINLAFGQFAAIGGYAALLSVSWYAGSAVWAPIVFAGLVAVVSATFHGIAAGRLVFAPLSRRSGQNVLVASVGLSLFLQEYLRLMQGSGAQWTNPILNAPIPLLRAGDFIATATPIALLLGGAATGCAVALLLAMRFSRFGRQWRAYADDAGAAALMGIDPAMIFAKTFALATALAGLAGWIMTIFYGGVGYDAAIALGLKALVAAVLGGIGSVPGAFLGGLFIGLFEAAWSSLLPVGYRDVAIYSLLVAVLIWRPGGFLGFADSLLPRRV